MKLTRMKMENIEYNQRTNPMVKFLMDVYGEDMNIVANIVTAQAEQNTKILICELKLIKDIVSGWIKELKEIDKQNESNEN